LRSGRGEGVRGIRKCEKPEEKLGGLRGGEGGDIIVKIQGMGSEDGAA